MPTCIKNNPNPSRIVRRLRADYWKKFICYARYGVLAVIILGFGVAGFLIQNSTSKEPVGLCQVLFKTTQLFVLNSGAEGPDNFFLILARFAAIGFVVMGVTDIFRVIFQDFLADWRIYWAKDHIVICGLGRIGTELCRDFCDRPKCKTVVVVERDETNSNLRLARELGAVVRIGDARDSYLLGRLHLDRAHLVFAVTGSDSRNSEIAIRVSELLSPSQKSLVVASPPPDCRCRPVEAPDPDRRKFCYVHIDGPSRSDLLRHHPIFTRRRPGIEVELFNMFERSARQLIDEHLLRDWVRQTPDRTASRDQIAHYAIVGFGQMGQAAALAAVRIAHFENLKRLRLTIIDEAIDPTRARFLARYPRFCPDSASMGSGGLDPAADYWASHRYRPAEPYQSINSCAVEYACNAEFLPVPGDVDSDELAEKLAVRFNATNVCPGVIVCLDDDTRNFDIALALRDRLRVRCPKVPIYVWLGTQPGMTELLERQELQNRDPLPQSLGGLGDTATSRIVPFGQCRELCRYERLYRPDIAFYARGIHDDYHKGNPSSSPAWEDLTESLRFSNYLAAEHIAFKLRILGCEIACEHSCPPERRVTAFNEKEMQLLARVEHNRWLAERLIDGWSYDDSTDRKRKFNKSMVPWECLSEERRKDFSQIELIPELIGRFPLRCPDGNKSKWCIARVMPGPALDEVKPEGSGDDPASSTPSAGSPSTGGQGCRKSKKKRKASRKSRKNKR